MRYILYLCSILLGSLVTVGCATNSVVPISQVGPETLILRTVSDPHALAPTVQSSVHQLCQTDDQVTWYGGTTVRYRNCHEVVVPGAQLVTTTGYIAGVMGPVIYAGGILGGGYFVGRGLGHSGGTTTTTSTGGTGGTSGSHATSTAESGSTSDSGGGSVNVNTGSNHGHGSIELGR
jgi:hypothetical protein